jgi:hypothetical protein
MTTSALRKSTVPITDLTNELNTLLNDYSHIHGAPKQVIDTLTDVEYLNSTLSYLETLFGNENHILHLPEPAQVIPSPKPGSHLSNSNKTYTTEKFNEIECALKSDLRALHHILRKWPNPPTFSAMVTFGALHNSEFKSLREKIIRCQLSFTVLIAEGTFRSEMVLQELFPRCFVPNLGQNIVSMKLMLKSLKTEGHIFHLKLRLSRKNTALRILLGLRS